MNDYLPKPYTPAQLIATIATACGRKILFSERDLTSFKVTVSDHAKSINLDSLNAFCEGDPERVLKYIDLFRSSAPILMNNLSIFLQEMNYEEISKAIHGFRTNWTMLGMHSSSEHAAELEMELRRETVDNKFVVRKIELLVNQINSELLELNQLP